jgi:hypothetical protein
MSIYATEFSVYERLASAKLNALLSAINSHTHNGTYGVAIPFSYLSGSIAAAQIGAGLIDGSKIAGNSITTSHIVNGTIAIGDINTSSIKLDPGTGYAVYAS